MPQIAAPTDAIVKIVKTTICGTNLHILKGDVPTCAPGRILGHEGIGVVDKVGGAVTVFHVGDRMIVSCISSCGKCDYCHTGGILDGPLAFDNAVSEEACKTKRIVSPVGSRADVLVVPDIEAGNVLAKQLEYLAEAQIAGIVLGCPRADHPDKPRRQDTRAGLGSCAIALLLTRHKTEVQS